MNKEVDRFVATTIILSAREKLSYRDIAKTLNDLDIATPSGRGDWQANTVKRIADTLDG